MSVEAISWCLQQNTGDFRSKLVLFCLANYADDKGQCWPSLATLAEQTEQSIDTVRRRLVEMEENGLIRREQRFRPDGGQTSDGITLLMPNHPPSRRATPPLADGATPPLAELATPPLALRLPHRTVTYTKGEEKGQSPDSNKGKKEEVPSSVAWVPFDGPSWLAASARYLEHRGKPLVPTGSKYGDGQGAFVPSSWLQPDIAH